VSTPLVRAGVAGSRHSGGGHGPERTYHTSDSRANSVPG
jgi:hypothetical protein